MYPQLMIADHKAESEYEDRLREGAWVRPGQAEGEDEILTLMEQIAQLQVVMPKPPMRTASDHPTQLGNRNSENRTVENRRVNGNG